MRLLCFSLMAASFVALASAKANEVENPIPYCAEKGLCGYVDPSGKWITPPKYDHAYKFDDNGFARVKLNGKDGLIQRNGNWQIPAKFESFTGYFRNGMAPARLGKKAGYIDIDGNWVIEPKFSSTSMFEIDGRAVVKYRGKSGIIDTSGNWVIEPEFSQFGFGVYGPWFDYSNEEASAYGMRAASKRGKWGFIDKTGNWVISPKYKRASEFSNGLAAVFDGKKWGYIDSWGFWVIRPAFEAALYFNDKGEARVRVDKEWKTIKKSNAWLVNAWRRLPRFFDPFEPDDGFDYPVRWVDEQKINFVSYKGKYGLLKRDGTWIVEPKFTNGYSQAIGSGVIGVQLEGKWGYINSKGEWLIEPTLDGASGFFEGGLVHGKIGERTGLMDLKGEWVIRPKTDTEIFELRKIAAENGNIASMVYMAEKLYQSDPSASFDWATKAAEKENASGIALLARHYQEGNGVKKDSAKTLEWLEKAAKQGDDEAYYNLAKIYAEGEIVERDVDLAQKYLRKVRVYRFDKKKVQKLRQKIQSLS